MKNNYVLGQEYEKKYDQALLFKESLEKKAVEAYLEAAREKNVFAQYRMAVYYSNGSLKDKELNFDLNSNAEYWLRNAANNKYEKAIIEYADYLYECKRYHDAALYYEDLDLMAYPKIALILYSIYKYQNRMDKVYFILSYMRLSADIDTWPYENEYQRCHSVFKDLIVPFRMEDEDEILEYSSFESIVYAYEHNPKEFDIFDFEEIAIQDIEDKKNKYIYLLARKYLRKYFREKSDDISELIEICLIALENDLDYELDVNPLNWTSYEFVNEKNAWAFGLLAELYLDGLGVNKNHKKAFEMLTVAHELNASEETTIRLADCYYLGYGVSVDIQKAYELYTSVYVQDGDTWNTRLFDTSIKRDVEIAWSAYSLGKYDLAYPTLKKLIEVDNNNHSLIHYAYAYSNLYGLGCEINYELARNIFIDNANKRNCSSSMNMLGFIYLEAKGVEKDYKQAFEWFKKSYEQFEDAYNSYNLGRCYYHGWGTSKDMNQAYSCFSKNINRDHAWTKKYLGLCYRFGYGVEKDDALAFDYLFEANKHIKDNKTKYELARCYYNGSGTETNKDEAFALFTECALNDYKSSYNYIGLCYLNGYGIAKDKDFAYKWFKKANDSAKTGATLYNLGLCYEKGYGVEIDLDKAFDYYNQSKELGNKKAIEKLEKR